MITPSIVGIVLDPSWGSASFIEICVGINLALASFEQIQTRVRYAENKITDKVTGATANIKDIEVRDQHHRFFQIILPALSKGNKWLWHSVRILSILAALGGIWALYIGKSCPWDFLLLLPSAMYLGWTYLCLFAVICWIAAMRGLLHFANKRDVEMKVKEFTAREGEPPDPTIQ